MPEEWPAGLDDWAANYAPRLQTFLRVLEGKEGEFIAGGRLDASEVRLSERMRRRWETGDFWVAYAARKTWAFDGTFGGRLMSGSLGRARKVRRGGGRGYGC